MKRLLPQYPKIAVYFLAEGETEEAILRHIKANYNRFTGISVNIDCAHGGSPGDMVDRAVRNNIYSKRAVFLDTDQTWDQEVLDKALANHIELIPAEPCGEGFLLSLLITSFNPTGRTSKDCKKEFEEKYLDKTEKLDFRNYGKILPLKKMEILRESNKILDRIICIVTKIDE